MKTTKITIKNLFGIRETTLDGKSVEISGPKGAGKTSVLDAIRFALTNRSERDCIVHQGADEGEIIIETTTGLSIDRKALPAKSAGTVKVRDGSLLQTRPAEFLSQIFTPLQLNPVEFTQLSRQEKNRVILSLIEFDWDVNWIREQFGEIPQGVDYSKHILEVLNDIQAENGVYFQSRQNINRDIRNKQAFISDIAKDIPSGYDYDRWNQYPIGDRYRELERLREKNSVIERAKAFRANFTSKLRGLEGSRDVEIGAIDRDIAAERAALTGSIERMKAELQATEEKLAQLSRRRQDRVDIATANFEAAKAKLEKDVGVAEQYADQEPVDTTALAAEVTNAEEMRKHLNEYQRMVAMQAEVQDLTDQSAELTRKIELARELPATILAEAHIPVEGLTVENGIPLINGLPISNLSDGELLELCVDISVCKPGQLEIMLNWTNTYGKPDHTNHAKALAMLQAGYYLIALMNKGLWTSSGHFVVVWWADNKIHINDPASTRKVRTEGDPGTFRSQVKYYWWVDARAYNQQKEAEEDVTHEEWMQHWYELRKSLQDNDSSAYSEEARKWAQEVGLITGNGTEIDGEPNCMWEDVLTREQFATVLYRFAKIIGKA